MSPLMIGLVIAIWIVGIPIALGFLKGMRYGTVEFDRYLGAVAWPLTLAISFPSAAILGLWFLVKALFRFGNWLSLHLSNDSD